MPEVKEKCPACGREIAILQRWRANANNKTLSWSDQIQYRAMLNLALNYCPSCKAEFEKVK